MTDVMVQILVFWAVTSCSLIGRFGLKYYFHIYVRNELHFDPEDGCSMCLRNFGNNPQDYMVSEIYSSFLYIEFLLLFYRIHLQLVKKLRSKNSNQMFSNRHNTTPLNTSTTYTPWPLFRKRTIPIERPPLVGEVSANFLRIEGVA
jgi:hypothetical protein